MLTEVFLLGARELAERARRTLGAQSRFINQVTSAMIDVVDEYERARPVLIAAIGLKRNPAAIAELLEEVERYDDDRWIA